MKIRFDRGTLTFDVPEKDPRVADLPDVLWDPRVRAYRSPAYRYGKILSDLERRGVWPKDEASNHRRIPGRFQPISLRPYQEAALDAWNLSGKRAVLVLPTGSGKTRTALAAMAREQASVLCLVPTRVLLDQWHREISRVYAGPIGQLGDGAHRVETITIATFESAYRHMPALGNRFGMLIVDEVHHFGGRVKDEAIEMCIAETRLGLTATPPAHGEPAQRLADLVGPTAYEMVISDLAGRFLADFDLITISVDLTPGERARYETEMDRFRPVFSRFRRLSPSPSWTDFIKSASRLPEGRSALASWRRAQRLLAYCQGKADALGKLLQRHRNARILVFTANNETAYAIARKHLIMPLTCDIGRTEREEVLQRFRDGELKALVSARVLNEGLDVPDASVAVVLGGTMGQREHVQRVGRILRPAQGKRALVFELVVRGTGEVIRAQRRREGLVSRQVASAHP